MKKNLILVSLLCLTLFPKVVSAKVISLIKTTNDENKDSSVIYVVVDDHNDIVEFGKKDIRDGLIIKDEHYSKDLSYAGVVLERQKGRDLVILRGLNVTPQNGGALELDYLYNGITGSRGLFNLDLDRTSDSWQIIVKGRIISHLHFKTHKKRFVGTVGIRQIQILK